MPSDALICRSDRSALLFALPSHSESPHYARLAVAMLRGSFHCPCCLSSAIAWLCDAVPLLGFACQRFAVASPWLSFPSCAIACRLHSLLCLCAAMLIFAMPQLHCPLPSQSLPAPCRSRASLCLAVAFPRWSLPKLLRACLRRCRATDGCAAAELFHAMPSQVLSEHCHRVSLPVHAAAFPRFAAATPSACCRRLPRPCSRS